MKERVRTRNESEYNRYMSENSHVAVEEVKGRDPSDRVLMRPEKLHFTGEGECVVVVKNH